MAQNNTNDIHQRIADGIGSLNELMEKQKKQEESDFADVFAALNEAGVDLSAEKILADYEEIQDTEELGRRYFEQYGELLRKPQKEEWINEELPLKLVQKIVEMNYTAAETGDLHLIENIIRDLETGLVPTEQPAIEEFYRSLILHAEKKNLTRLDQIGEYYDMGYFASVFMKFCHNRNLAFRNLIKDFFRTFEDADMKMLPSAYREVQAEKLKKK